jgi:hypothetical protein
VSIVVRAFVVGLVATGLLMFVVAAALGVGAASTSLTLDVRLGPLGLLAVERDGVEVAASVGPGLAVVAALGGLLNAAAAALLARRRRRGEPVA